MSNYARYWDSEPQRGVPLIGLIGKARAGKDSFAARLTEAHGYVRVAFADPLKQAALALDPIVVPGESWSDPFDPHLRLSQVVLQYGWEVAKDEIPEVRRVLQQFGQGIRKLTPDYWLAQGMTEAIRLIYNGDPCVITDVRYRNEADAIRRAGGVLVRIVRPSTATAAGDHRSETELDEWPEDWRVENAGTMSYLRSQADILALRLREAPRAS